MDKIADIIESISNEKNIEKDKVRTIIKEALGDMAKETISDEFEYSVYVDEKTKNIGLFKKIIVVQEDGDIETGTVNIKEAKEIDKDTTIGDFLELEINLNKLSRSSINYLFIAIERRLQCLIEEELYQKYQKQIGKILHCNVIKIDEEENTIVEVGEVKGILSRRNRIKGEKFEVGDKILAILTYVKVGKYGLTLDLSRTTPKFLNALLALEVPELKDGKLEIINSARIAGQRAKIAIKSYDDRIDPIGSIVGTKGVRITAVSEMLNNENIDCIEYSDDINIFISRSLSPAIVTNVRVLEEEKKALVTVAYDQKKKAIGSMGYNVRLASMLTGFHIDLIEEKQSDLSKSMNEKQNDKEVASSLDDLFS